jgi:hypothetical protein
MFRGDILVAQLACLCIPAIEDPLDLTTETWLRSSTGLGRKPSELPLQLIGEGCQVKSGLLEERPDDTFILRQEGGQQMSVVDDGVAASSGELSSISERLLSLDCQSFWSNHSTLTKQRHRRDKARTPAKQSAVHWLRQSSYP